MKQINASDIWMYWDYVRTGLLRIHSRTPERYTPEDVYHQLKLGNLYLYIIEKDGETTGFTILQSMQGWKGMELHVFAAYSLDPKVMDYAFEEVKNIGRGIGAKKIKFVTKRKGWTKRAEQLGYKLDHMAYEQDL